MPRFSKYTGAGNDFVVVRAEEVGLADAGALARRMCPRATGVGVDGLILLRALSEERIRVRFFNPDGSEFGTCGNGSRCAARYAVDRGLVGSARFGIVTDDGEVRAEVEDARVRLRYRIEARLDGEAEVELAGARRRGWLVQIGTPHFVIPVEALPGKEFEEIVRPIRAHPAFGTEGANVDLVRPDGPEAARIRTFERGVEGETLACGSGAMAAAVALRAAGLTGHRLDLLTRSGATLTVELGPAGRDETGASSIGLAGPARYVFDGVFPDASDEAGA